MNFMSVTRAILIVLTFSIMPLGTAHAQTCPASPSDWASWRDNAIDTAFGRVRMVQGAQFIDYSDFLAVSASIKALGERCLGTAQNQVSVPDSLRSTLGNFFAFFGALGLETQPGHQFGMTVTDSEYVNAIRDVIALPPLLKSQEFLRAVSDRRSYKRALDMIEANNQLLPAEQRWIPLIYKSRFLTTPDTSRTYGRFFVLVPGEVDKWIQFGILTPEMSESRVNNLSIAAVRRLPGHTSSSPRTETFIVDYWRTYRNSSDRNGAHTQIDVQTKFESGNGTENCSECHKTSVLGIHPETVYEFDSTGSLKPVTGPQAEAIPNLINSFIEGYGPPFYRGWQPAKQYGPPMGPVDANRPDAMLDSCSAGTGITQPLYDDLKEAMNCASCHNDNLVGRINFPQATLTTRELALAHPSTGAFAPLVGTYVNQGWMPPGRNLSPGLRRALVQCLQHEYLDLANKRGLLIDWLKGN